MMRAARDIRFDDMLAKACREDRAKFCNAVQPVGGRGGGPVVDCFFPGGGLCFGVKRVGSAL